MPAPVLGHSLARAAAALYDSGQRALGGRHLWRWVVEEVLRPADDARVLDLGCGTGGLLSALPASVRYVGVDQDAGRIAAARARWGPRATFRCGRAETLDTVLDRDDLFDAVVAVGLLHHLPDSAVREAAGAARRSLRRGGVLVTVDPVRHDRQPALARWLVAADRGRHVRALHGYRALVAPGFDEVESWERADLLRVPWTHAALRARAA